MIDSIALESFDSLKWLGFQPFARMTPDQTWARWPFGLLIGHFYFQNKVNQDLKMPVKQVKSGLGGCGGAEFHFPDPSRAAGKSTNRECMDDD